MKKEKNISLNIEDAFRVIDGYLPKKYTTPVLTLIPWSNAHQIRQIKKRRSGDVRVIRALLQVSEETKKILTQ